MIESFITAHYVMGFFLIVFTAIMVFSFFTSPVRRVFDLLDEIVVGHYTSKGGNYIYFFEDSKDTEESDEN